MGATKRAIPDPDEPGLELVRLREEVDQQRARAEAAEDTLRAVCKALGCDADSAEAQAKELAEMAPESRTEASDNVYSALYEIRDAIGTQHREAYLRLRDAIDVQRRKFIARRKCLADALDLLAVVGDELPSDWFERRDALQRSKQ